MKMRLLFLLLTACNLQVVAQQVQVIRLPLPGEENELLSKLERSKPGIPQIELLLQIGAYYQFLPGEEKVDLERAMNYTRQAQAACVQFNFRDGYNESLLLIGTILIEDGQRETGARFIDSALVNIKMDLQHRTFINQPERELRALLQLGLGYLDLGNAELAEKYFQDGILLSQAKGSSDLQYIYWRLAIVQMIKNDLNKALFYALEAIRNMEATGNRSSAGNLYIWLGRIYREIGQLEKAVEYFDLAYDFYKKKPSSVIFEIGALTAEAMTKMNRAREGISQMLEKKQSYPPVTDYENREIEYSIGVCYRELKQYDSAEVHLMKFVSIQRKDKPVSVVTAKIILGKLYVAWGKYSMAKPYLDQSLASGLLTGRGLSPIYFLLYKVDSAAGNYLLAMEHLMKNKELDEEIYRETKVRENQELQIKYETEKKDQDIRIKQASLQQANILKNVTFVVIVLLFIILGLLYNQYRINKRNNKEISSKNLSLERLLQEKEWLLKEVHHRVKNNLHTIMSLLESQSAYLKDDALKAIQNSQHRVYAMSLIHQKLYLNDNSANINMQAYLTELMDYLRDSFDVKQRIQLIADIKDIHLDISKAIPVGLILNEAVTNSIKYAFPDGKKGEITIRMERISENRIRLVIADNGIGIPDDWNKLQRDSLGLKLMKGLSDDVRGKLWIENVHGTKITLAFDEDLLSYEPQKAGKNLDSHL
jgi:two-component system, sensor histidine kinase PdtaS